MKLGTLAQLLTSAKYLQAHCNPWNHKDQGLALVEHLNKMSPQDRQAWVGHLLKVYDAAQDLSETSILLASPK